METHKEVWVGLELSRYNRSENICAEKMVIPFLPSDLIHPTYSLLQIPKIPEIEKLKLDDFLKYFKRFWFTQVKPSELSIFELENGQTTEQKAITHI